MKTTDRTVLVTGGATGIGLALAERFLEDFADGIWEQLEEGKDEAAYGFAAEATRADRQQLEAIFARMNRR